MNNLRKQFSSEPIDLLVQNARKPLRRVAFLVYLLSTWLDHVNN